MLNLGAAMVAAAEREEVNGKVGMESAAAAVSEGTVKYKKTRRRKQKVVNDKENGTMEQEAAPIAAAVLEGTVKCKKTGRRKQKVANYKENGTVEQEAASAAANVLEGCKKTRRKQKVVNDKENGTVVQEAASVAANVLEGNVKCKKRRRKQKVANDKENGMVEQEAASVTANVLEGTVKCKKTRRKQKVANDKENGAVEQEAFSATANVLERTVKRKKKRRKQEVVTTKENGTVEQEAASVAAAVLDGMVKCKKTRRRKQEVVNAKEDGALEQEVASVAAAAAVLVPKGMPTSKKEEVKAKERVMTEQKATTTSVPALDETSKCEKAKERGMVEQGTITSVVSAMEGTAKCEEEKAKEGGVRDYEATTTTVSALEGTLKCKKEKEKGKETVMDDPETPAAISALEGTEKYKIKGEKGNETGLAKQETTSAAVSASEGTKKRKRKKLKKKNKMQEQQESAQPLSGLVAVDIIAASKPGNSGTNGEGESGEADVSMDPVNAEDPNCSEAKDANDKVECKFQEGNKNCFEDRERQKKRPKRKRKRDASSRGPDISSHDGGRVAKRCLDSLMDNDLSCICASSLVQAHKEKVENTYSPRGSLIRSQRKKLLILDLNGLLADINMDKQNAHMAHAKVKGKLVFKRPYYDDFLRFCFQNFELGIWSSRKMENVNSVVDILMQDMKQYLLFCWDMSKCTFTGRKVIGDKHKPLVLKELKKLWNKEDPNLPWAQGEFSPSNTLLVDDSPYKALGNPPHTAIFPRPYSYLNQREDYSLGPGGDLRVYLQRLAAADDVQVFVRDNPFGQPSITESDPKWSFYAKIVNNVKRGLSIKRKNKAKKPA